MIKVGQNLLSPISGGGNYHDEIVEVTSNLVATQSLDYPDHKIVWWKVEEFKQHFHKDENEMGHYCKCWK